MPSRRKRPRNQRGFSLVVVFLLIIVMVGVSSAVMLSAQSDLQVSGHDREAAAALYAAEAGVSWAQWFLYRYAVPSVGGTWTPLLQSPDPNVTSAFCAPPGGNVGAPHPWAALPAGGAAQVSSPGQLTPPIPGTPVTYDASRGIFYQWCVHNNALDAAYSPAGLAAGDLTDNDNIVTVESWGWYGAGPLATAAASTHLTVEVAYFNSNLSLNNDYQQAGGGAVKQGKGEMSPNLTAASARSF